jgi:hypothetical protein
LRITSAKENCPRLVRQYAASKVRCRALQVSNVVYVRLRSGPDFDEFGAGELDGLHAVPAKHWLGAGVEVEPFREG